MPVCEGRPDRPCPGNRNDKSQSELFLCDACDKFRFPVNDRRQVTTATCSRNTVDTRGSRSCSDAAAKSCRIPMEDSRSSDAVGSPPPEVFGASATASASASTAPYLIVDELLRTSVSIEMRQMRTLCGVQCCPSTIRPIFVNRSEH
jgi:hypothetical protein